MDNTSITTLNVSGESNLDNTTIAGTLGVSGLATMDNATIANLTVTNDINLDNVTVGSNLFVSGTTQLNDAVTINDNLIIQDNASVGNVLEVTGDTNLNGTLNVAGLATMDNTSITTLNVTGASNLANNVFVSSSATSMVGTLSVVGLTTLDNTSITTLNVSGNSNLTGNLTVGGSLDVAGTATFDTLTADNATIGKVITDEIVSTTGVGIIRMESDGTIHIGTDSLIYGVSEDSISSSAGRLFLGDSKNHVTKVRGILSIQDPTEPDHAATRRYVDQSAAMAAALDTRNPEKGKNFHLQLGGASKNQENALGLNFAGSMFLVNAPGTTEALPFSISAGVSSSADNYMGKLSVGLSW